MKDVFFLRFSLQRSCAMLKENDFNFKEFLPMSDKEISEYLKYCDAEQEDAAQILKIAFGAQEETFKNKKILFIGDSITQDRRGYRGIITKFLGIQSKSVAFSGATSTDMLRESYGVINAEKPDIVSVMVGTNDVYFMDKERKINIVSPAEYSKNIRAILNCAKQNNSKVIVGMIPPMDEKKALEHSSKIEKYNSNENICRYNEILRKEIEDAQEVYIDTYTPIIGNSWCFEPDGVHLSPSGHKILAKMWAETIIKMTQEVQ